MEETKLSVRDLRISFRTSNGKVQAVRGINFDLAKGETLAIVGESGSGKSVTSKAILGIQAANAITESGEIIYDGKDLLKISEEEFHNIRGDKIAMIFQDPMSSLNPIVKIGKQLTEAMILKGKARQTESKKNFESYLKLLEEAMGKAPGTSGAAKCSENCKKFNQLEVKHTELESAYNTAYEAAVEAVEDIDDLSFEMEKKGAKDIPNRVGDIADGAEKACSEYVVTDKADRLKTLAKGLKGQIPAKGSDDYTAILASMKEMREILQEAIDKIKPDFFRMSYFLSFSGEKLPDMEMSKLNAYLADYMDKGFMNEFVADARKALEYTADVAYTNMPKVIESLEKAKAFFQKDTLDKKEAYELHKTLTAAVESTIDHLAIVKDSTIYTFGPSLKDELDTYFGATAKNQKAQKIHDRDQKKFDKIIAKGKTPDWQVAAAALIDMDLVKANMVHAVERLIEHYNELLSKRAERDFAAETSKAIEHLNENASGIVAKVTRRVAKDRAIKLMEEVGIAEPHKRYNQYPFEFSGGMRQRIVIAIALAANPDILICDEPTTALDVTIQSQILELINKLKRERQLSVIFITHDLGVVANMADRVAVMYAGKIVEYGTAEDVFYHAAHPYTWALLSSMPDLDTNERLESIPGTPPNMIYPPVGDAFAPRNKYAMQIDFEKQPPMFQITDTHYAATWLLHPDAPKVDPPKVILDRIARMKIKRGEEHAE